MRGYSRSATATRDVRGERRGKLRLASVEIISRIIRYRAIRPAAYRDVIVMFDD